MNRFSTEETFLHKPAHFQHLERELVVMTSHYSQAAPVGQFYQRFSLGRRYRKRFFNINMAT